MFQPEIETRPWAEQHEIDAPAYRKQLDYLFDNSQFYREKLTQAGFKDAAAAGGLADIANLPLTEKDELRASVKYLKRGGTLWYAPDQDMRGKDTVFAPFFGVAASTLTATHHLARLSGAAVIPFFHKREPHGGYAIRLEAPLEDFPSANVTADTARVNERIERMVREAPEQYLWVHKRFKTRPPGEAPLY